MNGPILVDPSTCAAIQLETLNARDRKRKSRRKQKQGRLDRVAVLDMETDPFDIEEQGRIAPFCACLYSDQFEPIVIWEEDETRFIDQFITEIEALPDAYTIYAHNGGKFDFMFLISRLRGEVMFKGRGIMSATIGRHEIRDSFHIIPEKLAAYAKMDFDYNKLRRERRNNYREDIIRYLVSDCSNLFEIVKAFLDNYGFKISIGQAAMAQLRKEYKVENVMPRMDEFLRQFFFGGRVECLQGKGIFDGAYKLYDVNSMYPFVMAEYKHPIGSEYIKRRGKPGPNTIFLEVECFNKGALVRRSDNNDTEANYGPGKYFTTIWEYEVAMEYNLIENVRILACVDCEKRSTFERFVTPLYASRLQTKAKLRTLDEGTQAHSEVKREDIFYKLIMNNAYGKFAQNPRRFKEHYITNPDERPTHERETWGDFPTAENQDYWIWSRPNPNIRFNNVGTAASITGAARATLLRALQHANDPIYCDTDSIICRNLENVPLDATALGAWDIEKEMISVIIAGKKLYAYRDKGGKDKIKSKGAAGLKWQDMVALLAGEVIETTNPAPTFTRTGAQFYMKRRVRATAKGNRNGTPESIPDFERKAKASGV